MKRTEVLKGLSIMNFEELHHGTKCRVPSQFEATSILGVSEHTFHLSNATL